MAKKKTEKIELEVLSDLSDFDFINTMVTELKEINPYADTMHNSQIYDIDDWIDLGLPALNMVVSSRFDRGIPSGRITQLYGESQSGKSLIASMAATNAQKKDYIVALMESEFGETKESLINKGLDPRKTIMLPVKDLHTWHKCIKKIIDIRQRRPTAKIMAVTDSLGNMGSAYESDKLGEGKKDQGQRQSTIRSIFKDITVDIGVQKIPFLFTNHTYAGPGDAFKGREQNISGGGGAKYLPTITVQFDLGSAIKDGDTIVGRILKPYTIKNRVVPPYMATELELDFLTGFKKYSGLLPVAVEHGLLKMEAGKIYVSHMPKIKRTRGGKKVDDHPTFKVSEALNGELGDQIWLPIMDQLQIKCIEGNAYYSPEIEANIEEEKKVIGVQVNGEED